MVNIRKRIANLATNIGMFLDPPNLERWIHASVRTADAARGRFTPKDGAAYIPHIRGWVYLCAEKNAATCAAVPISHYRKGGNGTKLGKRAIKRLHGNKAVSDGAREIVEVERSTALDLLNRPNQFETGFDFKYLRFFAKEACGNAFNYVCDDGQLLTMRPQFVAPVVQSGDPMVRAWVYGRSREVEIVVPAESVHQYKHRASIESPWLGIGPLFGCVEAADLLIFATTAEASRWRNEGRPPYAITLPADMNPVQRDQAMAEIQRQIKGVQNAGNGIVVQAAEITPLGFSPKDMEYQEGNRVSAHLICSAFGVPESLIWPNDSSLATAQAAHDHYNTFTIWPRLCQDAEQLTHFFQNLGLLGEHEFLAYENPSAEDNQAEALYWDMRVKNGTATLDEARADMGDDPLPDGLGAVPRFNGMPMASQAPDPAASLPVAPAKLPPAPDENKDAELQDPNADGTKALEVPARTKDKLGEIYTLSAIALNLKSSIEDWMIATFGAIQSAEFEVTAEQAAELRAIIKSHMTQAFRGGFAKVVNQFEVTATPQPTIVTGFIRDQDPIIDKIIETTNTDINRAITNWTTNGGSIEDFAQQITTSEYIPVRSELIANDRVTVAEGQGESDGASKVEEVTGKTMGKSWVLSAQPCKICKSIAAKQATRGGILPMSVPFAVAGEFGNLEQIDCRPAHINCGCEVVYEPLPEVQS